MSEQYAELITTFPLFEGFTANGTKRLIDAGEVKDLAAGEVLLHEGDAADFAVLVLALRTVIDKERSLIDSLVKAQGAAS